MSDVLTDTAVPPSLLAGASGSGSWRRNGPAGGVRRWRGAVIGVTSIVVLWEILAVTAFSGHRVLPTPVSVARQIWNDRHFYPVHIRTTVSEAAQGWFWGNLVAIVLAVAFVMVPLIEAALLRIAIALFCMPIIAIGPILNIVFSGDRPKVVLAALSVFFTTLIGVLLGLRSADRTSLDLITAYGGNRWTALRKVRMRAALPATFAGLKIAAPAALLGAIIGEYLGGEKGIGVAMISSEQALAIPRTWGLAFVATALAGAGYAITALAGRRLTSWAAPARS